MGKKIAAVDRETGEVTEVVTPALDEYGREILDPVPTAPPLGYERSLSMVDIIRQEIRSQALAFAASQADLETFEEADDFDVGDDFDPTSPYEEHFDFLTARELRELEQRSKASEVNLEAGSETPPSGEGSTHP